MGVMVECGCGEVFEAKRVSRYGRCPACALRAKELAQARWWDRQRSENVPLETALTRHVTNLVVVRDPLECGGFRAGAEFSQIEWHKMLDNFSFTPGTILRDAQHRLYEVYGGSNVSR